MAKIANNLTELIGGTPLMKLAGYSRKYGLQREVVAKLESFNPAGSVKDRVGLAMIEDAEARGALKPGATIIEPTTIFIYVFHQNKSETKRIHNSYISMFYMIFQNR